jgi:hypothetical protein
MKTHGSMQQKLCRCGQVMIEETHALRRYAPRPSPSLMSSSESKTSSSSLSLSSIRFASFLSCHLGRRVLLGRVNLAARRFHNEVKKN